MQASRNHILQLDGIRFLAILMVLFGHWVQWSLPWKPALHYTFNNGVTLFFVLSGYLITGILLTNKDKYERSSLSKTRFFKTFFMRRILRIFPIYYLTLFLLWWIDDGQVRELLPWLATYTINIYQSFHEVDMGKLIHLWSLSVEEQFYLLWPFLIAFVRKRHLPILFAFVIILSVGFKIYNYATSENWRTGIYFTLSCMDALSLGGLLAFWKQTSNQRALSAIQRVPPWVVLLIQIILITWTRHYGWQWYSFMFDTFIFALFSMLLVYRASDNSMRGLSGWLAGNSFSVHVGKISYGIYLYHTLIPDMLNWITEAVGGLPWNFSTYVLGSFVLVLIVAQLSWMVIEKPINGLKKYFPYI